ncbi:hypothetical protein C0989_005511 [Termitomyces sp. Mn162]|nr:hypothetical protein C0989_005511 [Termitomyces sp. Mn162]
MELQLVYATKLLSAPLLWGSTTSPVILVEGLSTRKCQRWGIQEVQISEGERPSRTCIDGHMLSNLSLVFFLVFSSTGRALLKAPAHGYLSLGPIYLGVVLVEPCETKDHVLPTQASDSKNNVLYIIPVAEDQVNHGADGACFVEHSINVVDWNWLGEGLHGQAMAFDKL